MIFARTFYRTPTPPLEPRRRYPDRFPREAMRLNPLRLLMQMRDEAAVRLAARKAAEAQRAIAAEPPAPAAPDPQEPEGAPSRTLLGW